MTTINDTDKSTNAIPVNLNDGLASGILEIASVIINLKNKKIELTAEEARIVFDELSKLLKDDKKDDTLDQLKKLADKLDKEKPVPYPVPMPYPVYPICPIYVEPYWQPLPYFPRRYEVWCGDSGTSKTLCINTAG